MLAARSAEVPGTRSRHYFGLDFLRGISILLVLCRHQYLTEATSRMGWIGVDLFFLISGFLIGSKLLEEHRIFGTINGKRFLIRRFLRIYPLYYFVSLLYILWFIAHDIPLHLRELFYDLILIQNYMSGLGFLQTPTWSLAIEEHFYLLITLIAFLIFNIRRLNATGKGFASGLLSFLLLTVLVGNASRWYSAANGHQAITRTHQRLEELVLGLTLCYLILFRGDKFLRLIHRYRILLLILALLCICWTPFIEITESFFAQTIGITCLALGFGALLLFTISSDTTASRFGSIIRSLPGKLISRVGRYSFAIYLIHALVNSAYSILSKQNGWPQHHPIAFIVTTVVSLVSGALLTEFVEQPVLRLRNRLVKSRV